jgi:alpha-beta hydrolase superfamily lysophospholipase
LVGQPVEFASASGDTLRGWLIPSRKGMGAIALMHGVRSTRVGLLGRARFLSAAGYAVLLFDFQAHGESTGQRITFGDLESKDAQAAVYLLRGALPGEKIGVIGLSMGGAAAVLATPHLEVEAMTLAMVSPTINQAIANRRALQLGGWAGALTPLLTWQFKPRLGIGAAELRPIDRIGEIAAPKLFIAGAEDQHTTLAESQQFFHAASAPKELWVVPGAVHNGSAWGHAPGIRAAHPELLRETFERENNVRARRR